MMISMTQVKRIQEWGRLEFWGGTGAVNQSGVRSPLEVTFEQSPLSVWS